MAAGMSLDMALVAAHAFEAECELAVAEVLETRRAKERARQAKHRAHKNDGHVMSRDETLEAVTQRDLTSEPAQVVTPSLPSLRSEELEEKGSEPKGSSQKKISGHFDQFWETYPRKVGKAEARKAFDTAWRKLPPFDEMSVLIGGLERAKAGWISRQRQFIPHAAKWLRGEHWTDEPDIPEPERRRTLTAQIGEENDEAWRLTQRLLEAERNGDRHRDQGRIGSPQHALPSPADGNQPTGAVVAGLVRGLGRVPH